jgi:tetratricopeptide (TPR) repeat protein
VETEKSIASTHNNLGMSYFTLKRFDEAIIHLNVAVEKYEKIVEKSNEGNAQIQD